MTILYIILAVVVGLPLLVFLLLVGNLLVNTFRRVARISRVIDPITEPIEQGKPPDMTAIAATAKLPEFRNELYDELERIGKAELFPKQYRTLQAFAESKLVSWLAHPNELQRAPSSIELIGEHVVDSQSELGNLRYLMFRFRVEAPHFAADRGWMAGVCGPFLCGANPPLVLPRVMFSEMDPVEKRSWPAHVQQAHKSFLAKGGPAKLKELLAEHQTKVAQV